MSTQNPLKFRRIPDEVQLGVEARTSDGQPALAGADDDVTTTVGVIYEHVAVSNVPILSVQWAIDGYPNATVVDYQPTLTNGTFVNLTPASLFENPVHFGWWLPGTYTVTAWIETAYGWGSASHTFNVSAPLVRDFNGMTGVVGVGIYQGSEFLRLAKSMQNFGADGLQVQAIVAATQSISGTLGGIQLASNERFVTHQDGSNWRLNTNSTYILDVGMTNSVLYQNHAVPIGTDGNNVIWDANDGPGQGLDSALLSAAFIGDGDPVVPETYRMHLMFLANSVGAVWVPLSIVEWSWQGFTQFESGVWTPAQDPGASLSNPQAPAFPQWAANTSQSQWVRY